MSRIARLVRRGPGCRNCGPGVTAAKRTMAVVGVAVVCFSAPPSLPAGASQLQSARVQGAQVPGAQAAVRALEASAAAAGFRVRALTVVYEQDNTSAAVLASQVALDHHRVASLQRKVAVTRQALQQEAIISYTGGPAPAAPGGPLVSTADPAVRAEYLQLAAGDISTTLDRYRTEEAQVGAAETTLAEQLRASEQASSAAMAARRAAIAEAIAVQAQLGRAQARLQQIEAAAAAASAAVAAGPPVGGGLVSVVRSVVGPSAPPSGGVWLELRQCESGDNYRADTGNGFYGAYQFSESTWSGLGYPGRPDLEPPAMQDQAAQRLQARSGWGQWPACSAALGLT